MSSAVLKSNSLFMMVCTISSILLPSPPSGSEAEAWNSFFTLSLYWCSVGAATCVQTEGQFFSTESTYIKCEFWLFPANSQFNEFVNMNVHHQHVQVSSTSLQLCSSLACPAQTPLLSHAIKTHPTTRVRFNIPHSTG